MAASEGQIRVGSITLALGLINFNPVNLIWEINKNGFSFERQWQGDPVAVAPGSRLEVENDTGIIDITPSPDDKLHLWARIRGRGPGQENARAAAEAAKIEVSTGTVTRVHTSKGNTPGWGDAAIDLFLQAPEGLSVSAANRLGSISVKDVKAGKLYLEASLGSVKVRDFRGSLEVETGNGEVNVSGINGDCSIESDKPGY